MPKANRLLLKLSGEALQEGAESISVPFLEDVARTLIQAQASGKEIGIVLGGGNLFRGSRHPKASLLKRTTLDQMGMLGTLINGLALRDVLSAMGQSCLLVSALPLSGIVSPFDREAVLNALDKKKIVIFVGGTGHPYFSTDTASALRALEIEASLILKATQVKGVYAEDPKKNPDAQWYPSLSFDQAIREDLKVMDQSAFMLCKEHRLPIRVFALNPLENLAKALALESIGSLIE